MQMCHGEPERRALALLCELQAILSNALNSLGGKRPDSAEASYVGRMARPVNVAISGYHYLRKSGRVDASRLLVRPVIEALFSAFAVMRRPAILLQIAYKELQHERDLFASDPAAKAEADAQLQKIAVKLREAGAAPPKRKSEPTVLELAKAAGLERMYPTYKFYCQFTHLALATVEGEYDEIADRGDSLFVCHCTLMCLDQLKECTPAEVPDLKPFVERLVTLRGVPPPPWVKTE